MAIDFSDAQQLRNLNIDPDALTSGITGATSVTATGGITARTLADRAADALNLRDFGAVCDGTTDDSAAVTLAIATHKRIAIPGTVTTVCNAPSISSGALSGVILTGPGRIKTSDGNLRGAQVVDINNPVASSVGLSASVINGFNGDTSRVVRGPVEHRITGALTAGNPVSPNYVVVPEISADWITSFSSSGINTTTTAGPRGRTGVPVRLTTYTNAGLGDMVGNWVTGLVTGTKSGLASWAGGTEVSGLAGSMSAQVDNAYLQGIGDISLVDGGHDVSAVGLTFTLSRTNDTAALGNPWIGIEVFSIGTKKIDAAYSAAGPMNIGYDAVNIGGPSDATHAIPAFVMADGQRLYGNATNPNTERLPRNVVLGTEYIQYSASGGGWQLFVGGSSMLTVGGGGAITAPLLTNAANDGAAASAGVAIGQFYRNGSVVMQRVT